MNNTITATPTPVDQCALDRKHSTSDRYTVKNGYITDPGEFEGESEYLPYFWQLFLDGLADHDDGDVIGFDVTDGDASVFPQLEVGMVIQLYKRDDGFVVEI